MAATLMALLSDQGGRCAVCAHDLVVPPNAVDELTGVVDRDAESKVVRGLLCHQCHAALGLFGGNPTVLQRAAEYLSAAGRSAS